MKKLLDNLLLILLAVIIIFTLFGCTATKTPEKEKDSIPSETVTSNEQSIGKESSDDTTPTVPIPNSEPQKLFDEEVSDEEYKEKRTEDSYGKIIRMTEKELIVEPGRLKGVLEGESASYTLAEWIDSYTSVGAVISQQDENAAVMYLASEGKTEGENKYTYEFITKDNKWLLAVYFGSLREHIELLGGEEVIQITDDMVFTDYENKIIDKSIVKEGDYIVNAGIYKGEQSPQIKIIK